MFYTNCPNCKRRGCYCTHRPREGDIVTCRYKNCDFFFWTDDMNAEDKANQKRWYEVNPDQVVFKHKH